VFHTLREFNGESDHVHLLINYPPKVCLSELVNSLKGVSSRRLKQEFPAIAAVWSVRKSRGVLWTPSYFAGSVGGAPLAILKRYIEEQGRGSAASAPTSPP
jgi:putative transposase